MSSIIFADAHLTLNDRYGLKPFRERALRTVLEAGAKADLIIDAGDSEHSRFFDAELMNWQTRIFTECLGKKIVDYVRILGNHDGSNRQISPFHTFLNGCQCYGTGPRIVGSTPLQDHQFYFRGWVSNSEAFSDVGNDIKYIVTHLRVADWIKGNAERAFTLAELESLPFLKRLFTGDLHTPKESPSGKVISIGALAPSSFADKDVKAGYIKFDEDHSEFERVQLDFYPIFRTIEIHEGVDFEPKPEYIKGNIIKFKRIGSPKFVQDKVDQTKWKALIWSMMPHYVSDNIDFEQVNPEVVIAKSEEMTVEDEIRQAAEQQNWTKEQIQVAIGA